ncbi:MAG: glucose-6-phosphate isomerase, partial [Methanocorpusculum sp.]|nr:glucose-6-phosphate isomerase [Methanocorpusculum sp.]
HGAAYYYMKKEGWVPNAEYGKQIPMHVLLPNAIPELGLIAGRSLYEMVGTSDTLDVMNRPEDFMGAVGRFCADKVQM